MNIIWSRRALPLLCVWIILILIVTLISNQDLGSNDRVFPSSSSREFTVNKQQENIIQVLLKKSEQNWTEGVQRRKMMTESGDIWKTYVPTFDCPHLKQRIGRTGDGGKWVCGLPILAKTRKPCVVYSYGINTDVSFEEDILNNTKCTLRGFDHTIDPSKFDLPQRYPGRVTIDKIGIGWNDTETLRTLKTEMELHKDTFVDILKMDIEGWEDECLMNILDDFDGSFPFGQLLIELHLYRGRLASPDGFRLVWETLENAGLRAFNSEPNFVYNSSFEYSFLNVKMDHAILHA